MLKEKIIYKDELPINVVTANIIEYPIHFHDDMEVVYVLSGSVILKNGYFLVSSNINKIVCIKRPPMAKQ